MKSDDHAQMLEENMEAITRQWETDKENWSQKLEQSASEIKMLKDTLSQKELVCAGHERKHCKKGLQGHLLG